MSVTASKLSTKTLLTKLLWAVVIITAVFFIVRNALPYFGFDPEVFGRYWPYKYLLVGHIAGGVLALAIGPFQFSSSFRQKYLTSHRQIGKVYIISILIGGICSLGLAGTVAMDVHWTWALALVGLAVPWILCVLMAFRSIKLKRVNAHREWMIRSYIVTFAFITFRILNDHVMVDMGNFVERAPTAIWISWSIPLMIGEIFLQWNKK